MQRKSVKKIGISYGKKIVKENFLSISHAKKFCKENILGISYERKSAKDSIYILSVEREKVLTTNRGASGWFLAQHN